MENGTYFQMIVIRNAVVLRYRKAYSSIQCEGDRSSFPETEASRRDQSSTEPIGEVMKNALSSLGDRFSRASVLP